MTRSPAKAMPSAAEIARAKHVKKRVWFGSCDRACSRSRRARSGSRARTRRGRRAGRGARPRSPGRGRASSREQERRARAGIDHGLDQPQDAREGERETDQDGPAVAHVRDRERPSICTPSAPSSGRSRARGWHRLGARSPSSTSPITRRDAAQLPTLRRAAPRPGLGDLDREAREETEVDRHAPSRIQVGIEQSPAALPPARPRRRARRSRRPRRAPDVDDGQHELAMIRKASQMSMILLERGRRRAPTC